MKELCHRYSGREISLMGYSLTLGDVDSEIARLAYFENDGIERK